MAAQKQVSSLTLDKERLEKDNVELFGKIKYLQTFGLHRQRREPEAGGDPWDEESVGGGEAEVVQSYRHVAESVEIKYRSLYESRMNPFAQFSHLEKQRKVSELTVADRLVLNTVSSIVSSAAGRKGLLAYIALMHVLVFVTLYFTAHRVHHECPPCIHSAATALHNVLPQ